MKLHTDKYDVLDYFLWVAVAGIAVFLLFAGWEIYLDLYVRV
jgi:hypothetical protein